MDATTDFLRALPTRSAALWACFQSRLGASPLLTVSCISTNRLFTGRNFHCPTAPCPTPFLPGADPLAACIPATPLVLRHIRVTFFSESGSLRFFWVRAVPPRPVFLYVLGCTPPAPHPSDPFVSLPFTSFINYEKAFFFRCHPPIPSPTLTNCHSEPP